MRVTAAWFSRTLQRRALAMRDFNTTHSTSGARGMWAHSRNVADRRHALVDHLRSTGALARRFAEPVGADGLAEALGLLHDAGKADCVWQERLLAVEGTDRPVGGDHKSLGARLLLGAAGPAAMAARPARRSRVAQGGSSCRLRRPTVVTVMSSHSMTRYSSLI